MITNDAVRHFLEGHRIAVAGASNSSGSFGRTVCEALIDHGYDPVPLHPAGGTVAGRPCYPRLADVPGDLDGVIVMVPPEPAADVVEQAAALGIDRVWLFKGIGGAGSVSPAVLETCDAHGTEPIAGACPLMFLEPVGTVHRIHRAVRRMRGDVAPAEPEQSSAPLVPRG